MRKIAMGIIAASAIGLGPAVYALPVGQTAACASEAGAENEMRCKVCTERACYQCEVIDQNADGTWNV